MRVRVSLDHVTLLFTKVSMRGSLQHFYCPAWPVWPPQAQAKPSCLQLLQVGVWLARPVGGTTEVTSGHGRQTMYRTRVWQAVSDCLVHIFGSGYMYSQDFWSLWFSIDWSSAKEFILVWFTEWKEINRKRKQQHKIQQDQKRKGLFFTLSFSSR